MEYTEEIKETIIKINNFIQANNNVNYKIRLLEREVPNLQELVKKLPIHNVSHRYSIDDIEKCVENWGLCKVEKEYIERFLNGC